MLVDLDGEFVCVEMLVDLGGEGEGGAVRSSGCFGGVRGDGVGVCGDGFGVCGADGRGVRGDAFGEGDGDGRGVRGGVFGDGIGDGASSD